MKKIIFIFLLLITGNTFSQGRYDYLVPKDTVFKLNDSSNVEPLFQLTISPLSLWTGKHVKETIDWPYSLSYANVQGRVFYSKVGLTVQFARSIRESIYLDDPKELVSYTYTMNNLSKLDVIFDWRFKSYESQGFKTHNNFLNDKGQVKFIKNSKLTREFFNISLRIGLNLFRNNRPLALGRYGDSHIEIDSSQNLYANSYNLEYFLNERQYRALLGINVDKLINSDILSRTTSGNYYSKLSFYMDLFYVFRRDKNFMLLSNDARTKRIVEERNEGTLSEKYDMYSPGIGLISGINYHFGRKGMLAWYCGMEFNVNPNQKYKRYWEEYEDVSESVLVGGYSVKRVSGYYFMWKFGFTIHTKQ